MKTQQSKASAAIPTGAPVAAANKGMGKGRKLSTKSAEPSGKLGKVVAMLKRPKGNHR